MQRYAASKRMFEMFQKGAMSRSGSEGSLIKMGTCVLG